MFTPKARQLPKHCRDITIALGLALLWSAPAAAADAWANNRKVLYLYPTSDGFIFQFDGARINPASPCESNRAIIFPTNPRYQEMVAILMTAMANGWAMNINYDDSTISLCNTTVNRFISYK